MSELRTILLVEDDADIMEVASMALETVGGFEVHGCDNGRSAVALARQVKPDIILLDWMMPGFDGGQTLEALRNDPETASIPVVFMTAKLKSGEVVGMLELGAADVIPKPFDPMALPGQVKNIWKRAVAAGST